MKKTAKLNKNIPMRIAAVLLCLTLISIYMVSGMYAKYTVADQGKDAASTASFYIFDEGNIYKDIQIDIIPGAAEEKSVKIVNKSEVTMEYTMVVNLGTSNLPLNFKLKNSDTEEVIPFTGNTVSYTAQLAPGEKVDSYTLYITWDEQANPEDDLACMGMVDYITMSVTAIQID